MSAIELQAVSKSYDGHKVVDSISIAVECGERAVLLGPSGCGKTTLLRLLAGLEVPDSGVIRVNDATVAQHGRNIVEPERRHIGMVFQDLALWPHMTVSQHLDFALRYNVRTPQAEVPRRIKQLLDMVRLSDRAHSRPSELSGGQQQRVALARALVANPAILLMDEPLTSLDRELALHVRRELLRLHAELHFTLVYVTHNPEEAADVGSRVIAMRDGRIDRESMRQRS